MTCSSCGGSGCPTCLNVGCAPCGTVNPCSNPQPTCTPRCSTPLPATPAPYYSCNPTCQEDNCQQIVNNYYAAAVCVSYAFNVPACGETANIYFPNVKVLPVGAYIWNENFGYFEVISFNPQTGQAVILNNCNEENAAAGTNIPACTCFIISPPPVTNSELINTPYLAVDFTAPADTECVTVTLTTTAGLSEGDTVGLGTGTYLLDSITSGTTAVICNEGNGITPGTVVEARNEAGQLQYPVFSVFSCCHDMDVQTDEELGNVVTGNLFIDGASANSVSGIISITNSSPSKDMAVLVTINAWARGTFQNPAGGGAADSYMRASLYLLYKEDGVAVHLNEQGDRDFSTQGNLVIDDELEASANISWQYTSTIPPGGTKTYQVTSTISLESKDPNSTGTAGFVMAGDGSRCKISTLAMVIN